MDNDFKLSESIAIFRYLSEKNNIDNSLYPTNLQDRARVDEYLEWQHMNTRMTCSYYYILKYLKPRTIGKSPDDDRIVASAQKQMEDTLNIIEKQWLSDDKQTFIGGLKDVSMADLLAACELEQPS